MSNSGKKIRLSFNSPVILGFTIICFIVLILDKLTGSASTRTFFSVYRSSLASPFTYIRFFGHVLGHASWDHFFGNIMMLLAAVLLRHLKERVMKSMVSIQTSRL